MRLIDTDLINNYAHEVTHGLTMVSSDVYLESTRIRNTDEMVKKLRSLRLSSVDTGFFNLYLASELHLSDRTELTNLLA